MHINAKFNLGSPTRIRVGTRAQVAVSEPSLGGDFYVKENPGTYLEVENTGEGPATAIRVYVESPDFLGIASLEGGFTQIIPLVDAGDGFTVSLNTQPLTDPSGDLGGFLEYYSLDGTRHELDLSSLPVIIEEGNETDPEGPYVYPPPPGERGSGRASGASRSPWTAGGPP